MAQSTFLCTHDDRHYENVVALALHSFDPYPSPYPPLILLLTRLVPILLTPSPSLSPSSFSLSPLPSHSHPALPTSFALSLQTCSLLSHVDRSLSFMDHSVEHRFDYRQRAVNLDRELFLSQFPTLLHTHYHPHSPFLPLPTSYRQRAVNLDRALFLSQFPTLLHTHYHPHSPFLPLPSSYRQRAVNLDRALFLSQFPTLLHTHYHPHSPFLPLPSSYRQRAVNLDRALFLSQFPTLLHTHYHPHSPFLPLPSSYRQRAVNLDRALFQAHRGHKLMRDVRPAAIRFHVFMGCNDQGIAPLPALHPMGAHRLSPRSTPPPPPSLPQEPTTRSSSSCNWIKASRPFLRYVLWEPASWPRRILMYMADVIDSDEHYFSTVACPAPRFNHSLLNASLHFATFAKGSPSQSPRFHRSLVNASLHIATFAKGSPLSLEMNDSSYDSVTTGVLSRSLPSLPLPAPPVSPDSPIPPTPSRTTRFKMPSPMKFRVNPFDEAFTSGVFLFAKKFPRGSPTLDRIDRELPTLFIPPLPYVTPFFPSVHTLVFPHPSSLHPISPLPILPYPHPPSPTFPISILLYTHLPVSVSPPFLFAPPSCARRELLQRQPDSITPDAWCSLPAFAASVSLPSHPSYHPPVTPHSLFPLSPSHARRELLQRQPDSITPVTWCSLPAFSDASSPTSHSSSPIPVLHAPRPSSRSCLQGATAATA
ncbi:unnamed protein product [Closterium sp. Naga37s-1]|nr:unnamed protein product [Closterium sp. Naga37s-1]